jgi:integrase
MVYNIGNLLKWWGIKTTTSITAKACRQYAATKTPAAAGADLKVLKAAVLYWNQEYGPLGSVPTYWLPPAAEPRERWLTRSEAARLLWAARHCQHIRRFILLSLYTASRPGVILAARWNQINLAAEYFPAGAVQDRKKRAPRVRLGKRILAHLRRWKRLDGWQHDTLPICHYDSRAVADPHDSWKRAVKTARLDLHGPDKVTRHTLRHTKVTWLMQAGLPIWEVAGFAGMSVRTLERVYGHHHPDHQVQAANAR